MFLEKPLYLLLLLAMPFFVYIYKNSQRRAVSKERAVLILRLTVMILLVLALARPYCMMPCDDIAVMFVADLSDSIDEDISNDFGTFINQALISAEENDRAGVIVFGKTAQFEQRLTARREFEGFLTNVNGSYTNIAGGLELALANIPDKEQYRVVLLSDGEANSGNILQAAVAYQEQEIPIDILLVDTTHSPEVYVDHVAISPQVKPMQEFAVKAQIYSTDPIETQTRLYLNDILIEEDSVLLQPGHNLVQYNQKLSQTGFHNYRFEIHPQADSLMVNNWGTGFVVVEGLSPILVVHDYESDVEPLMHALNENDMIVENRVFLNFPNNLRELQRYAAVVINDLPANYFSHAQMQLLHSYVHDLGGGLIVIGGKRSYGMGDYSLTQLDTMLPVNSQIEQRVLFPTLTMLLVIDKSGSMSDIQSEIREVTKLDLALEAGSAVVDMLVSEEQIGILAFDIVPEWVVDIQKVIEPESIKQKLARVNAGGGTNIFPALQQAYEAIAEQESAVKHILLLSDGISEEDSDYQALYRQMADEGITLSTIAIGNDADQNLMQYLAEQVGGEYYHTTDLETIPQIFIAETNRILRRAISEESFQPLSVSETPVNRVLDLHQTPFIHGYIATSARELADVHLITPDRSPLLASWRYGLGRTVSLLTDIGDQWMRDWVGTQSYNTLFGEMVRYASRDVTTTNIFAYAIEDNGNGKIIVDAVDENGQYLNFLSLFAAITDQRGNTTIVDLKQTAPGEYRGEFNIDTTGTFLINIGDYRQDQFVFHTGLAVPYLPEYRKSKTGEQMMMWLAGYTNGRIIEDPGQVFARQGQTQYQAIPIWTWLVLAAMMIFLIDIALRVVTYNFRGVGK